MGNTLSKMVFISVVLMMCIVSIHAEEELLASSPISSKTQNTTIVVDVAKSLGPVNPLILGHNIIAADGQFIHSKEPDPTSGRTGNGIWDPETKKPVPEIMELCKELNAGIFRYPGGCVSHRFNWKCAVGSLETRPNYLFGINEYITVCRTVGAEPHIVVSAYVCTPTEAGELVEYLNAPAGEDHPWAKLRAQSGHPEPYNVKFFEMGNESDHGNHGDKFGQPFKKLTPQEYIEWFNACSEKMRSVDPTIKMGALTGTGAGPYDPWNRIVSAGVKDTADFIIVHTYMVGLWTMGRPSAKEYSSDLLMRACMASGDQIEGILAEYRAVIKENAGKDIPLAMTEYNAGFVQDLWAPKPYRFSLGAALYSADCVRIMLKPETNMLFANYFQLLNAYWGLIRGSNHVTRPEKWVRMPAFFFYRLWGQHFGSELVATEVDGGPHLEFEGVLYTRGARESHGAPMPQLVLNAGTDESYAWEITGGQSAVLKLKDFTADKAYPVFTPDIPVEANTTYCISYEARSLGEIDSSSVTLGIGVLDARGWAATLFGAAAEHAEAAQDWTQFSCELTTLSDCAAINLHWRLRSSGDPVSATLEVRNLKIEPVQGYPPYAAVTALSSLSEDKNTLYLIVFNKHHSERITSEIEVAGTELSDGKVWQVTGSSMDAINTEPIIHLIASIEQAGDSLPPDEAWKKAEQAVADAYDGKPVFVDETTSGAPVSNVEPGGFMYSFPPYSMTAFELTLKESPE